MQFENTTETLYTAMRRKVEACMETGNFGAAKTVIREYADVDLEKAKALRLYVVSAYGTAL